MKRVANMTQGYRQSQILRSIPFRAVAGLGIPAAALGALWFLYRFGALVPCPFHLLTGLHCPGCGSGRALAALLRLDFGAALGYNVLFVAALPLMAYYLLKQYIVLVFRRDPLPLFHLSLRSMTAVLILLVGFWVLRNIPIFPFTWLAP